ncbi:MAG: YdcF family protein [Patescibacteria group bacterium]
MSNNHSRTQILFVPAELIDPVNQLSSRTLARCKKAFELWQTEKFDFLVVTGGRFLPPSRQTTAAGVLMSRWFNEKGVNPEHIVIEEESFDTFENISGSVQAMQARGLGDPQQWDITIVTQRQHAARFEISFWNMYQLKIRSERPDYRLGPIEWCKEWLFILVHLFDPYGRGSLARRNRDDRRLAAYGE